MEPRGLDGECQSNLRKIIPPPTRITIPIHLVEKLYSMDPIHKRNRLIIEYEVLTLETKYKGRKLDSFKKAF